jgi:hypothetical protein
MRAQMNSGLQSQANMRPHSAPTQSWRGNTAPSGVGLHPKPVESWNRIQEAHRWEIVTALHRALLYQDATIVYRCLRMSFHL